MREIALDTETTGLDPEYGHRVVEIGCVEMFGRVRTGKVFHTYLNPERDMPAEAERIHGISGEFLKDKPLFASIGADFLEFIGDATLVIHNASFDMKFLNYELKSFGLPTIPMERVVDTLLIARRKFPGAPANLDALCRRFTIDLSARTKHGALLDAELLADVYMELMGGRQSALTLDSSKQEENFAASPEQDVALDIPLRVFAASNEERASHRAFIGKLKNPIWGEYLMNEQIIE